MSAFSKGDKVRCINADGSGGELTAGETYTVSAAKDYDKLGHQVRVNGAAHTLWWREDRFEKVEPEPLKEDDAVLLWARVVDAKPDSDGEVEVSLRRADGYQTSYATTYTLPDAIVRPDAGQVPPWVKPARCTSLLMVDKTTNLRQCTRDGQQAHTIHQDSRGTTWVTAAEYGRVEVSS